MYDYYINGPFLCTYASILPTIMNQRSIVCKKRESMEHALLEEGEEDIKLKDAACFVLLVCFRAVMRFNV